MLKQFDSSLAEVLVKAHKAIHGKRAKIKVTLDVPIKAFPANGSHGELRYIDLLGYRILQYNERKNPDRARDSMVYVKPVGSFVEGSMGAYFKADNLATGMIVEKENGPSAFAFDDNGNGNQR